MRADENGGDSPNYEPNSFGGPVEDPRYRELPYKISARSIATTTEKETTITNRPATFSA
ncbi:MAG: hypothetical protein ACLQU1_43185 [Bryobacteraceae bacterium]